MRWRSELDSSTEPSVEFARDLRGLLDAHVRPDLGNSDFARTAGISPSALSAAVSGRTPPSAKVLDAILRCVGVRQEEINRWQSRRELAASGTPGQGASVSLNDDVVLNIVRAKHAVWDLAQPGDPDYRLNTRLLKDHEVVAAFPLARA